MGVSDDSTDDEGVVENGRPQFWSAQRRDFHAWLERNARSLAQLYEGALTLSYGPPFPGRVRFICHAVREIGNKLPETLTGVLFPRFVPLLKILDADVPRAEAEQLGRQFSDGLGREFEAAFLRLTEIGWTHPNLEVASGRNVAQETTSAESLPARARGPEG